MELESLMRQLINGVRAGDATAAARTIGDMIAPLVGGGSTAGVLSGGVAGGSNEAGGVAGFLGGLVDRGGSAASGASAAIPLLGLLGLLGGSRQEPAGGEALRFQLPAATRLDLGFDASTGSLGAVDYGDRSAVRAVTPRSAPQINIQVSAMDSKSFLDRSDEIADAVRSAVLRSHSLNDVLGEE